MTKINEYNDLFDALPWSHGTLGLLVNLELRIVPSKPFVKLVYKSFHKQKDYIKYYCEIVKSSSNNTDSDNNNNKPFFLETIIFSKNDAVIMEGKNSYLISFLEKITNPFILLTLRLLIFLIYSLILRIFIRWK